MTSPHVAIIGAGWAGLACAVELAGRGHAVTVFEAGHTPGGRARGVVVHDTQIDNGQHILVGAYDTALSLMRRVGADPDALLMRLPLTLNIPGHLRLTAPHLPAPWHVAVGLLRARGLSLADKIAVLRLTRRLYAWRYQPPPRMTVRGLMDTTSQTARAVALLWDPLCVAALNTGIDMACATAFARVLQDTLGGGRHSADMLLPRCDLTALFPQPAAQWLAQHGGQLRCGERVTGVEPGQSGYVLHTTQGSHPADHVVVATAPHSASGLIASHAGCAAVAAALDAFEYEPIVTVYLQFDAATRLPAPILGVVDGTAQWVFDRGAISGQAGLIAAVISARGRHLGLSKDGLITRVLGDIERIIGPLPAPRWHQTITEKRATFSCSPQRPRVPTDTLPAGLWLCGDYLDAHYPATLESAVRCGVRVAQGVVGQSARA